MRNILTYLSGADPNILRHCPTEKVRFGSLGAAVLLADALAGLLLAFGCDVALRLSPEMAGLVGIGWAGLMLSLDRWLVAPQSTSIGGRRVVLAALPRILLALPLALIFS